MTLESSLSQIPEAPSAPHLSTSISPPASSPIRLEISSIYLETYPTLFFHPYQPLQQTKPTNVLSLVHNAVKQQLAYLVSVIIPAFEARAAQFPSQPVCTDDAGFGESFTNWWNFLLRFLFFVAETNDQILQLVTHPIQQSLEKRGDFKTLTSIKKQHKSILDRHEFTMEFIFRAAEKALNDLNCSQDASKVPKLVEKLQGLTRFVLDTLQLVMNLATELEEMEPGLQVSDLEYIVADNVSMFARGDRGVFLYACVAWMKEEEDIRKWIVKYGGFWGRLMFGNWKRGYEEQRMALVDDLRAKYLASSEGL